MTWSMKWTKPELNHVRVSMDRSTAQQLSNELGRAKEDVEEKIREIEAKERLSKLTQYVRKIRDIKKIRD